MDRDQEFDRDARDAGDIQHDQTADLTSPIGSAPSAHDQNSRNFTVNVATEGVHDIRVRYANGAGEERVATLHVDYHEREPEMVSFPQTGGWSNFQAKTIRLMLAAGTHVLTFSSVNKSGPNIADISVSDALNAKGIPAMGGGLATALNIAAIAALATTDRIADGEANVMHGSLGEAATKERTEDPTSRKRDEDPSADAAASNEMHPVKSEDENGEPGEASAPASSHRLLDSEKEASAQQHFGGVQVDAPDVETGASQARTAPVAGKAPAATSFAALAEETDGTEESEQALVAEAPIRLQAADAVVGNNGEGDLSSAPAIIDASTATGTDLENAQAADSGDYIDFSGSSGDFNAGSGEYAEWTFSVAEAGYYDVAVGYAFFSGGAANRPMRLDVNGEIWDRIFDMPNTGSNTTYDEVVTRVYLEAGDNTIRLTSNGFSGPNIDYLEVRAPDPNVFVFQGEDLVTKLPQDQNTDSASNRAISPESIPDSEQFRVGAEGGSYLDWAAGSGATVADARAAVADFTFNAPVAGTYAITLTYATSTARPLDLKLVDGETVTVLNTFAIQPSTAPTTLPDDREDLLGVGSNHDDTNEIDSALPSAWEGWAQERIVVTLDAGENTLRLQLPATGAATGPNIDKVVVELVEPSDSGDENTAPTAQSVTADGVEDTAVVIDLADHIDDADSDALTITEATSDQGTITIDGTEITFVPNLDFFGQSIISYTVSDPSGATATNTITVDVAAANDQPTLAGTLADQTVPATGGAIDISTLTANDVDGDDLSFGIRAVSGELPDGIAITGGQIVVQPGVAPGPYSLEVFVNDGSTDSEAVPFLLTVEEEDATPAEPLALTFDASTLTSYSSQDVGTGASVSDDGSTLHLDGNLWKRAPLGSSYTITENTKLTLTVTLGTTISELVAVGFDDDNSPFEMSDRSVYQIAGTESQAAFVDLREGDVGTPGETITVTIDLSAHAGKTISSLVFIADDDSLSNGIGSASFSNVQLLESGTDPDENTVPEVVGGGISDLVLPERGNLEIDMPFMDDDGDALSYSFTVTDSSGNPVSGFEDLVIEQGTLKGQLDAPPSTEPYIITITADDGNGGVTSTDFTLTIENVNDAPELTDNVAFEPIAAVVGQEISGIDLAMFADAFSDPDGDPLTLSVEGLPAGLSLNSEGVIVGTPLETGDGTITIFATDPEGLRSEFQLGLLIDGPTVGDVTTVQAEAFTGLDNATNFYTGATPGASGNQVIRTNANQSGSVTTNLAENGLSEGWYEVSITVYDETDGTATFSLMVGDTVLADGLTFDDNGTFDNPAQARGNGGQSGNLKTISFSTPVFIDASTLATLTGVSDSGEYLRIDKLTFTRVETPQQPPTDIVLDSAAVDENTAGTVIGLLSSTDPDGDSGAITYSTTDPRFVIDGNELSLAEGVSLDHESGETVTVEVTATDANGLATTSELTITVGDVNEAPELAGGAQVDDIQIEAGSTQTIDIAAALGATDPDEGASISYVAQLAGGAPLPDGMTITAGVLQIGDSLPAGTYELIAFATDGNLDSDSVSFTVTISGPGTFDPITIQAEEGNITLADNGSNDTVTAIRDPENPESNPNLPTGLRPDFTGTGYLDFGDTAGDTATYTINVAEGGTYTFNIRYATNTDRPLDFSVNGSSAMALPFVATDPDGAGVVEGFDNWMFQTVTVELDAGENTFSFAIPAGFTSGPNIDRVDITRPDAGDVSADEDEIPLFLTGPQDELNETEAASINFNIAGLDADIVKVEVSFDGGLTRTEVLPDTDGDFTVDGSELVSGPHTATVIVTDDAGNEAQTEMDFVVAEETGEPFLAVIEAETFTPDDVEAIPSTPADTVPRTPENNEPNANEGNSGPGQVFDEHGLRPGYEGEGYMDFGNDVGDAASFTIDVPAAGTYQLTVRYANGGTTDRPMTISVGGVEQTVDFPTTTPTGGDADAGWSTWQEVTIDIELEAGTSTVTFANEVTNGPNIDNVTISSDGGTVDPREQVRFEEVVKINFEPAESQSTQGLPDGYETPEGYFADLGIAFGDRGNGFSYGWVTEASVADGTANGTIVADQPANAHWYKDIASEASDLQKTYAHFEYPGGGADNARAWEMALEDGTYQVTMSIGDTAGAFDSTYVVNVEGESFMPSWVPANPIDGSQSGDGFRSTLVTGVVTVTDGRLTIDSIGGTNTEIQYLEIERIPDLTPDDDRPANLDYSFFTSPVAASLEDGQVSIAIGPNGELPTDIDPTSSLVVGVNIQAEGNRGPNINYVDNIKLVETLTGIEVDIDVQISGGADSLTIRPLQQLKENTSYTLKVQDVMDLGSITDPDGELRQFQDLTTTFVTGEAPEDVPREVAFSTSTLLDGYADGAFGYTTIEFGPDGKLYVATITGEIHRWDVNADGTIDQASQESLVLDYLETPGDRRGIVGFTFDPEDPDTIWITDNAPIPRESKAFDTPEFSGRISKITLGEDGSFTGATAEAYITGLPRSGGDHLTNSLEFRPNPNAGQEGEPNYLLYLTQGSNSAAGAPDGAWGNRPERLLNASVLEIDPRREAPEGGFDVRTEPIDPDDAPTSSFPADQFNEDGTYPGMYNPFAEDAVLKIYATGVRNAYDLVWHSNGHLYVPTNGTASGGKTPTDPSQPGLDTTISNSPKQYDYFFTVEEGGYYGHPNPLRDEYVLNGGNPTAGQDPNEVVGGNDGNPNTDGYQTGVDPDENYDLDGVYNLGYNQSPNGAIEYIGNAFGSNLKGAILIAQFSTGDNVRMIRVDTEGNIIGDDVLRRPDGSVIDDYIDPLDIIENPVTGQLYLMTLNRGTGASQLVLLTPAPGGVTEDLTADEGGNLSLVAFDVSDPSQAIFQVNGLDDDITALRIQFNDGPKTTIELDGQNRFIIDLSALEGEVIATLEVTDDALNVATTETTFTPGEDPVGSDFVTLVTIQAEDKTPADGTAATVATSANAEIEIRDASNPETGTGPGYVDGLRPGAVGTDGNTNNLDDVPGGYADYGASNADFITFTFDVPEESAGTAILRFRYSNGGETDRPLQLEVNGSIVTVQSFVPTGAADIDGWTIWAEVEIPVSLIAGQNTVTLRSVASTGPNIDQLEVLVPSDPDIPSNDGEVVVDGVTYVVYEAENAEYGSADVVTEDRNQSGGAFVDFVGTADQFVTWTISVSEAGTYSLDMLYALATTKTGRPMQLTINGTAVETLPFPPNSNEGETIWGPQSATVDLQAGLNTITVTAPGGVGPNIDLLRVTKEPVSVFEPDFAEIEDSGRIELEAGDGSANTVNGSVVDFYFTVAADGIYKLDAAANADATNGQGLTWFLNGVEIDESDFPGIGEAGEESVYIELEAGTQYQIRIVSDAPGANGIDYLDVAPAPGNANADIEVESLDPAYLSNRLHFSYLENPDAVDPDAADRDFKDSGTVRLSNSGTEPLEIVEAELSGPFVLANPGIFDGLTIPAGGFVDIEVLFDRSQYTPPTSNIDGTSTVFAGELNIVTNDADSPVTTIDLAGFWQARDEGGQEPNVNEIWQMFGFGNRIEGLTLSGGGENSALSTNDVFAKTDETEVLSPYWRIADGYSEAKITQIAAFHGTGGATIGIHNPGNKGNGITFWNHEGTDNQRLLPNSGNDTTFSTETFTNGDIPDGWLGNEVFGISVAGLSTDPRLNPTGGVIVPGEQQGHTVKVFQALDADGNVIPNVYLGIMDYTGINYDYNDNLFVIEGVEPVGFGQEIAVDGLDDAAADARLVFTSIDDPANDQQNFRNEATITISNSGFAELTIEDIILGDPEAFEIVGAIPTSIAPGGSAEITVRFIGTHGGTGAGAELYNSTLTIVSDDAAEGTTVIQLAGLAQEFSENGSEPTVAQIVEAFGYGTDMAQGELAAGGQVETVGDEVLMPYLEKLDASQPVEVIQLAAFLQQNNVARLGFHGLGSAEVTNLFAQDDQEYQTVLPNEHVAGAGAGAGVARGTINQNGPFGLFVSVDGRPTYASWSDPEANRIDPDFGQLVGEDQGHLIRFFQALDADGNVIEGTYIAIQDYPGAGNYDYNDHVFIIKNVKSYELTSADDANSDGVNDVLQDDADNDGTVDFFDPDTDPGNPGEGDRGEFVLGINFGGGAIANDPVLGVPLVDQNDPRVTLSGSINPGAGADAPSNPNGANATPGSAFTTYEDGSDWTASIDVPNGTYVVVLHTQETYWNASGQRQFDISVNGEQVVSNLDPFAQAGGDTPIAIEAIVTVTNGEIVIDLSADIDNASLNAVTIYEYVAPGSGQEPVTGTPFLVDADSVTVDAVDYDEGGQGVAYNDTDGLQGGGDGGRTGTDVEVTGAGDIGWIDDGEWLEYTIDVENAGEYELGLLLSNGGGDGRTATVSFYRPGEDTPYATTDPIANPQTASWSSFVDRTASGLDLEAGEQIVRVTFTGGSQDFRSFSLTPVVAQAPFGGTAPTFSGGTLTVDATNFDEGGQGIAYNDDAGLDNSAASNFRPGRDVEFVGAELDIGHVEPGEWVEYTIDVPAGGLYNFSVNAKTPVSGATVAVSLGAGLQLGVIELADGHPGGSNFGSAAFAQSESIQIPLSTGLQTIRLAFDGPLASNGYVLDLRSFTLEAADIQTPVGGVAPVLNGDALTIDGIDYDEGGQDVAYSDAPGLQGGSTGGRSGSDVEVTGNGDIGWIDDGEWLEYTIDVADAGTYTFDLSMALGDAGGPDRSVTATFTNGGTVETVTVDTPRTGSWSNFQTTESVDVDLPAGTTVVRLTFNGGSQDLSSFSLTPSAGSQMALMSEPGGDAFFNAETQDWPSAEDGESDVPPPVDDHSSNNDLNHVFGYDMIA